ncbi:MAG: acetyl-CoA carboxylase carboxyltransferase subunit alpha [Calditrichaeota bacterium]|nr:acetyl-CoA carboxylase carboxyltransferase subunit alpha [Candidatus Cloacimonadota bacterium]MCA9786548.1 acetyl-CoA carboxylase carboxyltransferase subunit alpha [Candidatus Cloacimonadota bacterium]MCB1048475.1 acetyl-CoA carboxylase carboxyltransferase subunit alpha [Calditrichota bacterium]MCB9474081.1 acetyl-CoA carboxylase carboxyltransferase subunit alpha [Candidatus Delongbacteria bacterium]
MSYGPVLEFEKPIAEIERRLNEMRALSNGAGLHADPEIARMEKKLDKMRKETFSSLTGWQTVQLARHPRRPFTLDYIERFAADFMELHGDRAYGDDHSIVAGVGHISGRAVAIIGHQKGRDTKSNIFRNFGMSQPEGYRKALRVMRMAERFGLPVLTLVDTPGAWPGLGAEARGQAEAIARNLFEMAKLRTPVVSVVIGEGGSGGALALAVADRVLMLEHSIYSVISPEGCASILFRDAARAQDAAEALKLTAPQLKQLKLIDEILPEPLGGAHRDWDAMAETLRNVVSLHFEQLCAIPLDQLVEQRIAKFDAMGVYDS